jgi:hypothetical protein
LARFRKERAIIMYVVPTITLLYQIGKILIKSL